MNRIKRTLQFLIIAAMFFGAFYAIGSFGSASFDISKWSKGCLGFVTTVGGALSLIFAAATMDTIED